MNTTVIFNKYAQALDDIGSEARPPSTDAVLLALRLAIQEAADANAALVNDMSAIIANLRAQEIIPESALVAAQNEVAMLRQRVAEYQIKLNDLNCQLVQLDADNADLVCRLAAANTAFACKWEDLPTLKWEQVKL